MHCHASPRNASHQIGNTSFAEAKGAETSCARETRRCGSAKTAADIYYISVTLLPADYNAKRRCAGRTTHIPAERQAANCKHGWHYLQLLRPRRRRGPVLLAQASPLGVGAELLLGLALARHARALAHQPQVVDVARNHFLASMDGDGGALRTDQT